MDKEFNAWFAGFFDGEGTIGKGKYCRTLSVSQALYSDRSVVKTFRTIQETYGGYLNYYKTKGLPQIKWVLTKREGVEKLISNIVSFAKLRNGDLKSVLSFYESFCRYKIYVDTSILYSNKPHRQIAEEFGCSRYTIYRMRREKRRYFYKKNKQGALL